MQEKVGGFLKRIDQFGVQFSPKIDSDQKQYRSVFGGVSSMMLYGMCFGYFMYGISQWAMGNNLPTITTSSVVSSDSSQTITGLISQFYPGDASQMNPFNQSSLVLVPWIAKVKNNDYINAVYTVLLPNNSNVSFQNASLVNAVNTDSYYYIIKFKRCKDSDLIGYSNLTCANQTQMNTFFNAKKRSIAIDFMIQEFNTQIKQLQSRRISYVAFIDQLSTFSIQSYLQIWSSQVDQGILFPSMSQFNYIGQIQTLTQSLSPEYFGNQTDSSIYVVVTIKLDNVQVTQNVEYQKINQVLADIGSILSIILMLSYFVILANQQFMENECKVKVIEMYYPQLKDIQIKKDHFGRMQEVLSQNGNKYNTQQFNEYYTRLKETAEQKMTMLNIVYELSRIQFILQTNFERNLILQSHKMGIKLSQSTQIEDVSLQHLNIVQIDDEQTVHQSNAILKVIDMNGSNDNQFQDQDFKLLVYDNINSCLKL